MLNNQVPSLWRQTILPSLSLFTSIGTLLCCALPALLVTLGMGAALAGLVGSAPWITAISDYKAAVFTVAGVLIALAASMQWRARNAPCPADPAKARACSRLRKVSWSVLGVAGFLYLTGFFFAFIAVHIFY
jgi:hypothetical protein